MLFINSYSTAFGYKQANQLIVYLDSKSNFDL